MEFYQFAPELYQICKFVATTTKLSIDLEQMHFLTFSTKCHTNKIEKRDGHGKSRNCHKKVMEKYKVCGKYKL